MAHVTFSLRAGLPDADRKAALRAIGALPGVRAAVALKGDSASEAVRRLCVAEVDDDKTDAVIAALHGRADIESAERPAKRRLVD